jgi:hypothetical protein
MRVHASSLNDYELFIRGRRADGGLTRISSSPFSFRRLLVSSRSVYLLRADRRRLVQGFEQILAVSAVRWRKFPFREFAPHFQVMSEGH